MSEVLTRAGLNPALDEELAGMVATLEKRLAIWEGELAELDAQREVLNGRIQAERKTLNYLTTGTASGDPASKPGPKPKSNGAAAVPPVTDNTLAKMREWFTANRDLPAVAAGFSATGISEAPGFPVSHSTGQRGVHWLAESGFLRIDRRGRNGNPVYKVA